jgi:sulfonate transport system permease protein
MTGSATKQSSSAAPPGLLRFARNDGEGAFGRIAFGDVTMSPITMTLAGDRAKEFLSQPATPQNLARLARPVLGLVLPATLAVLWEFIVRMGWATGRLAPPPSVIFATFVDLAKSGELQRHTLVTLWRVGLGFGIGVAAATVIGAAAGYSPSVRRLIDPSIQGLRAIPSIAWVPLFILWLGIFEASKVTLIAVGVFFPVYFGLMGAILSVDRKLVEVGRAFRLSAVEMVRRILLPAVLPAYVLSLRSGLALGWMFVVAAELMGASDGLVYLLVDGQQLGKPAEIVAAIVAFAVVGQATDWLIALCAAPFLRWEDVVRQD